MFAVCVPAPVTRLPGSASGTCFAGPHSPWSPPFAPPAPLQLPPPRIAPQGAPLCSPASQLSGRRRRARCSRAGLRPPPKLDVQFSRIQLSRRRSPLSGDGRDQRDKIDEPKLAVELAGWQRCPTAAAPFAEPVRPDSSHQPAVESVEELSDVGPLVVVAPTTHNGVRLFYQLLSAHRSVAPREPANLILEVADRFLPGIRIQRSRLGTSSDLARRQP